MSVEKQILENYKKVADLIKSSGNLTPLGFYTLYTDDYYFLYGESEFNSLMVNKRITDKASKPLYVIDFTDNELLSVVPGEEIEKNLCRKYL